MITNKINWSSRVQPRSTTTVANLRSKSPYSSSAVNQIVKTTKSDSENSGASSFVGCHQPSHRIAAKIRASTDIGILCRRNQEWNREEELVNAKVQSVNVRGELNRWIIDWKVVPGFDTYQTEKEKKNVKAGKVEEIVGGFCSFFFKVIVPVFHWICSF